MRHGEHAVFPHGRQSASAWPRAGLDAADWAVRPRSVRSLARLGHRAAPGTHRTEVNDPSACPAPSSSTCSCGALCAAGTGEGAAVSCPAPPPGSGPSPAQGSAEAPHARCAARRGTGWCSRGAHLSAQPVRQNIQPLALFPPGCRPVWPLPGGHGLGYGTSGHSCTGQATALFLPHPAPRISAMSCLQSHRCNDVMLTSCLWTRH